MPHAVREAMANGLPTLLSDIPGHRMMADEGKEALFFGGEEDFVRHVARLIQDASLRKALGSRARERVTKELSERDEIDAYLALLKALV
jgi:glycosyltransferase involved in cell wall biosynthesis